MHRRPVRDPALRAARSVPTALPLEGERTKQRFGVVLGRALKCRLVCEQKPCDTLCARRARHFGVSTRHVLAKYLVFPMQTPPKSVMLV
jgi:hypothetical protein